MDGSTATIFGATIGFVVAIIRGTVEPSYKKRGRLRKFVVHGNTSVAEPSQKKRGRPRKSIIDGNTGVAEPSQKKRGRPRKSFIDGNTGVTDATSSENPSKKASGRILGSEKKQQQPKTLESQEDRLALMEIPIAMWIDKSQMVRMESPNIILHEIVSQNFGENNGGEITYQEQIAKGITESKISDDLLENILTEADISPRMLKSARKEKK
ncbi:hypothetical protein T459_30889 [Capsicum annuum]|uniref:Uncharacterized protein n=1 Tax=Capsicum annuum TaxID=4072 RepID=A0A2G2Y9R0_CAPAN|nr:hypothetical protein T459_30889 [Capsicum annuum]